MNDEEIKRLMKAAQDGSIPDSQNPLFLFSTTDVSLLLRIAGGELDATLLARTELAARGLDLKGEWVGFDEAKRLWSLPRAGLRRHRKGFRP